LADLVTEELADYAALALRLATQPPVLHSIRQRVDRARDNSPLFDSGEFTRALESTYLHLVEERGTF
jgi:predicted O-linked N-acetylglucosamine transferase (SPINDLY family)